MKVTILEPCGYCSGVERAMKMAIETKKNNPTKNVVVLGMLVHNKDSLKKLEENGITTIYKKDCSLEQLIDEIKEPSIVVLTAHGHSKAVEEKLLDNGHEIVDATCPFVKSSFDLIEAAVSIDRHVFYIGVENHPECIAALSISDKVHFLNVKKPEWDRVECERPVLISQTTLSEREVERIEFDSFIHYPKIEKIKGICNASTARQDALICLPDDVDLIYVVGDVNSNNTKTLFNLAKYYYPETRVELIQNASEVNKKDLLGLSHIVISSGASTPREVVEEIKSTLLN